MQNNYSKSYFLITFMLVLVGMGCNTSQKKNKLSGPYAELLLMPYNDYPMDLKSTKITKLGPPPGSSMQSAIKLTRALFVNENSIKSTLQKLMRDSDDKEIRAHAERIWIDSTENQMIKIRFYCQEADFSKLFLFELYNSGLEFQQNSVKMQADSALNIINKKIEDCKKILEHTSEKILVIRKKFEAERKLPTDSSYLNLSRKYDVNQKLYYFLIEQKTELSIKNAGYLPSPFLIVTEPTYHIK